MKGPFPVDTYGQEIFESGPNSLQSTSKKSKLTEGNSRNYGNMNRTIMPVASGRWNQMDNNMINTMRYAPNTTSYSSAVGSSHSVDYEFDRMTDVQVKRDLRLHPAQQSLGSTCLLK